ncbi:MAG: hypothetical protein LBF59_00595 [Prevotellaceae bacterium]|jgi:predicted transposase/invertase (TIGR01784 family)|nr:hypothetical protein [Prevotellaceae bacterium]
MDTQSLGLFTEYAKLEGWEEGLEKGEMETYTKVVLNALEQGFSVEDIAKFTGISIKQVCDILKNQQQ